MAGSSTGAASMAAAKRALRAQLRTERAAMPPEERARCDAAIAEQVVASPAFARAPVVFSYLSFGAEVQTRAIIHAAWDAGKVVALPRVVGPCQLTWYRVDSLEGLVPSAYGMEEPAPDPSRAIDPVHPELASSNTRALALVPGLAFDREGYRLGYGGGFYDAFLRTFPGVSLGLCHAALLYPSLAACGVRAPHDVPVTAVIFA